MNFILTSSGVTLPTWQSQAKPSWFFFLYFSLDLTGFSITLKNEVLRCVLYLRIPGFQVLAISQLNLMQDPRRCISFAKNNIQSLSRYSRSLHSQPFSRPARPSEGRLSLLRRIITLQGLCGMQAMQHACFLCITSHLLHLSLAQSIST